MSKFNVEQFFTKVQAMTDEVYVNGGNEDTETFRYLAAKTFWHKATINEIDAKQYLSELLVKYPISLIGDWLIRPRTVAAIWRAVYKGRQPYEQLEIEAENVPLP